MKNDFTMISLNLDQEEIEFAEMSCSEEELRVIAAIVSAANSMYEKTKLEFEGVSKAQIASTNRVLELGEPPIDLKLKDAITISAVFRLAKDSDFKVDGISMKEIDRIHEQLVEISLEKVFFPDNAADEDLGETPSL